MDMTYQTCVLNETLTCVTCPVILEEPVVTNAFVAGSTSGVGNTLVGIRVGGVTCLTGIDPCVTETKCSGLLSVTML